MKRTFKLKIIIFAVTVCSGLFVLVGIMSLILMGTNDNKNALAASAYESPERIEELMRLKAWGVPSDLVMMVTTYQCENREDALTKPFIFNALDFMFMTEIVKEYVHHHDEDGDSSSENYHDNCGYETVAINYYWHREEIKGYIGIDDEETSDLNASNLEEKAQEAADALCEASPVPQIRIIQFNAISRDKFDYALELCGVEKEEDRKSLIALHEAGYFISWLEEQATQLGIDAGEGSTMVGSNGVHNTITFMTADDDTPLVDETFISPIGDNWRAYVTCEIGGYAGHTGIDFGVPIGTAVRAVASGTVIFTGTNPTGYGEYCVINHGGKIATLYAHNSQVLVYSGQTVTQGQIIAYSGNTGNVIPRPTPENPTAGAHLHFEVVVNGVPKNPRAYLP